MGPRPVSNRLAALALAVALALGFAGRVAVHESHRLPHGDELVSLGRAAVALGAPWLAAAWAIGVLSGSRSRGARAGGAALALGTAAWYLLTVATKGASGVSYALPVAAAWVPVALVAGALFGFAGGTWSDGAPRERAVSIAALAGCLAGEALLLVGEWSGRAAELVLGLELAAAVGLLAHARRHAPLAVTLTVFGLAALACAAAEAGVREALLLAGWNGPTL
jgi:hypothetical protein